MHTVRHSPRSTRTLEIARRVQSRRGLRRAPRAAKRRACGSSPSPTTTTPPSLPKTHYRSATNMTDMTAGLAALARTANPRREQAFAHFHDRFRDDPLVLDKWMGLQAMSPQPDTVDRVRALMGHPVFSLKNPNRVRALIGAFAIGNPLRFHDRSGAGYRLVREVVQTLDSINPQTAARMAAAFETWRRYDAGRQPLMRAELEAIAARPGLSANLYEMATKMLG